MLTVTDAAAEHLSGLLDQAEAPEDVAVRFVLSEEGLGLELDNERPGDATFNHETRTVLVVDEMVNALLDNRTLDVESGDEGIALTLT
jgi:Fe-S cluster assembly iron-binding protein IscA